MKKIFVFILSFFFIFICLLDISLAWCKYSPWNDIVKSIWDCVNETDVMKVSNAKVESWVNPFMNKITKNIAIVLSLSAVFAIVYGAFMMVTSVWEDEKIKKWKDIVKWWIIGFLWVVLASGIIRLVVTLIYSI